MDDQDGRSDGGPDPQTDADATHSLDSGSAPHERIGRYTLLQKLGEGGMGEVWLAEQTTPVRRRVALKLIKPGMDSTRVIARFEAERQALALMTHPNVAQVIDAGTTDGGRLYFVMEYVEGLPITKHCDRYKLTMRQRLELILEVCEGLQHAHRKGIIHRDIKPSNVLVTVSGDRRIPKLIDFGVAKATAQKLTERTVFTELGQLIGTPEYMSPEQAEMTAEDVDTRSDVYSLGVLLYELLVGALPFGSEELRSAGFDELRRKIREDEPLRPSTKVRTLGDSAEASASVRSTDPRTLRKRLRGDLDWITMKALSKDRTRRYGSATELADDIRRHLRHEPVEAGPPSMTYKAGRFVRRHRLGVAVGGLVIAMLIAFGLRERIQAARVARERDEAIWRGYALSVQAAVQALQEGRLALARSHLEECPPNLRGWEWRMVHGTLPAPPRRMDIDGGLIGALRSTEDGSELRVLFQKRHSTVLGRRHPGDLGADVVWVESTLLDISYRPDDVVYHNSMAMDPSGSTVAVCDMENGRLDVVSVEDGAAHPLWSRAFDCGFGTPIVFAEGNRFLAVREAHSSGASPQERRRATKVFDVSSGAIVTEFPSGYLAGAAEAPILGVLEGDTLALRDLETGRVTRRIPWSVQRPDAFVLTPRAERAFLGFDQGLLMAVDFAEKRVTRLETNSLGDIGALATSPDGRLVAYGTTEGIVGVIEEGYPSRLVHRMGSVIRAVAVERDGSGLFAADRAGAIVRVPLDAGSGSAFRRGARGLRLATWPVDVRFGRDGRLAAAVTWGEQGVVLIDGTSLRILQRLYPKGTGVQFDSRLHWSADGHLLVAYPLWKADEEPKGIRGWRVDTSGRAEPSFVVPEPADVFTEILGAAPDTRSWLRRTPDGGIVSERADSERVRVSWQVPGESLPGPPESAVSDERRNRWIAYCPKIGLVSLDAENGRILKRAALGIARPYALDPTGALLLVEMEGPALGLVDAETLRPIESFPYPDRSIGDARFTPDGSRFVVGFDDGTIEVWSTARRKPVVTLDAPTDSKLKSLDVASDGRMLVAYGDGLVAMGPWNVGP